MKLDPNRRYVENTESGEIFAYDPIYLSIPHIREYFGHRKDGGAQETIADNKGGNKGGSKGSSGNKTGIPDAVETTKNTLTPESTSATPNDIFNE